MNKTCCKCNEEKPLSDFPSHIRSQDGYDERCKSCKYKAEVLRKKLKKNAPPMPSRCECCGKEQSDSWQTKTLCLDHNHDTNEFRGWLCDKCNRGIGFLGDNIEGVAKALAYLRKTTNE